MQLQTPTLTKQANTQQPKAIYQTPNKQIQATNFQPITSTTTNTPTVQPTTKQHRKSNQPNHHANRITNQ